MALEITVLTGATLTATVEGNAILASIIASSATLNVEVGVPGPAGPQGPAGQNGQGVATGGTTGQALVKLSNANYDTGWATINSAAWGNITGTLSNQTDLYSALNGKLSLTGGLMSSGALIDFSADVDSNTSVLGAWGLGIDNANAGETAYIQANQIRTYNGDYVNGTSLTPNGINFNDETVQVTAYDPAVLNGYLPLTGGTMSANASVNFTSNVYPETPFLNFTVNNGDDADFGGYIRGNGFNFYDNNAGGKINGDYYNGFTHTNGDNNLSVNLSFNGITYNDLTLQTTAYDPAVLGNYLPLTGGTMSGDLSLDGNSIYNAFVVSTGQINFGDSSVQTTAWLGYNGTTSQYITGTGSLVTFPPVGDRYLTSSTSTLTCDSGNGKTMTVGTGLSYSRQQDITVSYDTANHMHGTVLTYNSTTGVMTFDSNTHSGGGTYSSWEVNVGGVAGAILPVGGTAGQVLAKINSTNFNTEWKTLGTMSTEPASAYLSTASAVANYLTISSASSTYQTQSGMSAYLSTASAVANYLTISNASSTYQTQSGMSAYLSTSAAASTYQTQAGMSAYLSTSAAASTYQTQSGMSAYLSTASAVANYQSISGMSAYLSTASASANFIGTSAYATTAQAQAGTSTTTVINPSTLLDAKFFAGYKPLSMVYTWTSSVSGTGASTTVNGQLKNVYGPTSAIGSAMAYIINYNAGRGIASAIGADFTKRTTIGGRFIKTVTTADANSVFRFLLGKNFTSPPAGDLSQRGIGFRQVANGALELQVHNGTTLYNVTSSFTPTANQSYDVVIIADAGTATMYVNGSSVATSANAPTATLGSTVGILDIEAQNTSTLSGSAMTYSTSDMFVQTNL